MTRHLVTPFALVAAVALPGCPLVDVEADVQKVCMTYANLQIDAAPSTAPAMSVENSFTVDNLSSFKALADQNFTLGFVTAEAHATQGISDFAFVTTAKLAVASGDPSSTLPTLDAFSCDGCAKSGSTIEVDTTPAVAATNVAPYVESGSLIVTIDLAGRAPDVAWAMDVDVCMTGSASYKLNE